MQKLNDTLVTCIICKHDKRLHDVLPTDSVRGPLWEFIACGYPSWKHQAYVCFEDLNNLRAKYIEALLKEEKGELTELEEDVLESMADQDILVQNLNTSMAKKSTVGERMADRIAKYGGSWTFILFFMAVLAFWIFLNSELLARRAFDPYPYILLNLVLSCLAAVQAPIIMMSQNRQAARDRAEAEADYQTNLKSELEIRHLNAKIDLLLSSQWEKLLEIQNTQQEILLANQVQINARQATVLDEADYKLPLPSQD